MSRSSGRAGTTPGPRPTWCRTRQPSGPSTRSEMIELFYYPSPNTRKVVMLLEEIGLPYVIRWVDLLAGEQHTAEYRAINPNGKVPTVIDQEGEGGPITLFESGAILLYLAEKTGRLL